MRLPGAGDGDDTPGGDAIGRLIVRAGPRTAPPEAVETSVRAAVEQEWTAALGRRRRARSRRLLLAAVLSAAVVGIGWLAARAPSVAGSTIVGTLVSARGAVHIAPASGSGWVVNGEPLRLGTRIATGSNAMVLLTIAGVGVRVGPSTSLELEREGALHLTQGRVYVDSGPSVARAGSLTVDTQFARVTHRGTQFQVSVEPDRTVTIAVREGTVRVSGSGHMQTLARGEGLEMTAGGAIARRTVAPYDSSWNWVSALVPEFSIEGQSLLAFLDWFARETGRTMHFIPPVTRSDVERAILSGNISGLTPAQALDAVMATTRFGYDMRLPGELRISARESAGSELRTNAIPATGPLLPDP